MVGDIVTYGTSYNDKERTRGETDGCMKTECQLLEETQTIKTQFAVAAIENVETSLRHYILCFTFPPFVSQWGTLPAPEA